MPEFSFIVPYFNKSKTIKKCLKSLTSQSEKDIEIIVVFDGPDPKIKAEVSRNKKLKVIEIPHGGACAARNAGAAIATGKYIVFWDADCYIEHGAAGVWKQVFESYPGVDFVYSGYRFQEGDGGIASEPFDPWMLRINNYISGCFPIRREKAPKWDESLKSLQDWDFWLTAVENGSKGYFVRGYAFSTELPDKDSISGKGCTPENWMGRVDAVKQKHSIPQPTTCVTAIPCRDEGIRIAKMLNVDYMDMPFRLPTKYDRIIQIGFEPRSSDTHARNFMNQYGTQPCRILFWRASDVYTLKYEAAMAATESLAILLNSHVDFQFCEDFNTQKMLDKMGFKAEVFPLPISPGEMAPLPEKFNVLVDVSPEYKEVFDSIKMACPDIKFKDFEGSVCTDEYSLLLSFHNDRCIDTNMKKVLMAGRRVVSNVQSPFCGHIDDTRGTMEARSSIISAIREVEKEKELNVAASKYYTKSCSPEAFKEKLLGLSKKELVLA